MLLKLLGNIYYSVNPIISLTKGLLYCIQKYKVIIILHLHFINLADEILQSDV